MLRKVGFFVLSLSILFVLVIVVTIDVPIYWGSDWEFVNIAKLCIGNIIPILCMLLLLVACWSYYDFRYRIRGTAQLSFKIVDIEKVDYESLTFLTTYTLPLVCFDFDNPKYQFLFVALLIIICLIYVRTDMFYTNPVLTLLNFRIYKVEGLFDDKSHRKKIILTRWRN